MSNFLTLIMLPSAPGWSKQKSLSLVKKSPFSMGNCNLSYKLCIFWPMGQKDGNVLFWSTPELMVTVLALKYHTFP